VSWDTQRVVGNAPGGHETARIGTPPLEAGRRALLIAIGALALFAGLGSVPLWEPDEARFAEATRQMLASGDWLTPWYHGQPRFEKPILIYWLQLPFHALLGPTELATRLPIALSAAGCLLVTYLIGVRLIGRQAAWLGTMALATSFRFFTHARIGLTDMPALFFQVLAVYGFLRNHQEVSTRGPWITAWVATGLAALTRGPVAVIPAVVWITSLVLRRDWSGWRRMHVLRGALIAAAVAAPWYLYMVAVHGRAFLDVAVGSEVVSRVGGGVGPRRGLLYYFEVWPADLMPWTPFFLAALGFFTLARSRTDVGLRQSALVLVLWFAVVVGLFSLSSSKIPNYILPAYPAAALLVGLFIDRAVMDGWARRLWWVGASLVTVILVAAAGLVAVFLRRTADASMPLPEFVLPLILAAGGVAIVFTGRRLGPVVASASLAVTLAVAVSVASLLTIPSLGGLEPVPKLGRTLATMVEPGDRVGQYGVVSAGLVFYSRHDVVPLQTLDDVARFLAAPGRAFCVIPRVDARAIAAMSPGTVHEIAEQPRVVIRLDRLLGDGGMYAEPLALVSNREASDRPGYSPVGTVGQ
jgi:4-amino-4-deoxy-L-arabinose transferase-like glycosyltransferase